MKKRILFILLYSILCGCAPQLTSTRQSEINTYHYDQLSDEEKQVYNQVYLALKNHEQEVSLNNTKLDENTIFHIASTVSDDHPEFFYFFGDESYVYTDYFIYKDATLSLKYAYSLEEIENYEKQLEEIKESYLNLIQGMDQEQIIEYTYDYLIQNTKYDEKTLEELPEILDRPDPYGLIGAFINHNCVCSGYAKAFQYLLNAANIHCLYIRGYLENQSHAWNAVLINGEYYHFDVTSDDLNLSEYPPTFYQFFGLNTTQILQHHVINDFVEETSSISQNYHVIHNHYLESIDELDQILEPQKNNELITIQCADYNLYLEVINELITQGKIYYYLNYPTIHYSLDQKLFYIQFYN